MGLLMNNEHAIFIKLLSDHLSGRKSEYITNVDWAILTSLAKAHQVEGIVFYQCKNYMPSEVYLLFERKFSSTVYYYKNRERVWQNVCHTLNDKGIPVLSIKGLEIANYYPVPSLRTMGDLDILVHLEDKEKAGDLLEQLGFIIKERNPYYDWQCSFNGLLFELHHNLLYQEAATRNAQSVFFNDYWNYEKDGRLDWSFHFLYLIAHLRKHLMNKGVGFRMFMDLAVVIQKVSTLDWLWIEEKLNELEMLRFAQTCFALIKYWFGISVPIEYPDLDAQFLEETTEKILTNGVFGFQDRSNDINNTINQLNNNGRIVFISRIKLFWKMLFPSYYNMANCSHYKFIRDRAWLLPVAWVYRLYRMIMGKTTSANTIIKRIMTSKNEINKREAELRKWGLW